MNINKFNIGDTIVRTERTAPTAYGPRGDGSYIGEKLTLAAIANGLIYCKRDPESPTFRVLGLKSAELELEKYSEGWEYYKEVNLDLEVKTPTFNFKEELRKLVEAEDYETLSEVRDLLDNLTFD